MSLGRCYVVIVVATVVAAACGGPGGGSVSTTNAVPPPSPTVQPTTTAPTATSPSTTAAVVPTTAPACDPADAVAALDHATEAARLVAADTRWTTDLFGSVYADAVVDPEAFAAALGFVCSLRVAQAVGTDHERIGLVAWTGRRMGYVVVALDPPTTPYEELARFDLLFEQPWGEWVSESIWAVTVSNGDTVIVATDDYPHGPVAKSFLAAFPEPPPAPIEITAEEYAIAALVAAGAGNVGIAQPSATEVASIAFVTPLGNPMVATVGLTAVFDPFTGYLTGERTVTDIEGVEVHTVLAGPDQHGVADVSFVCADFGWRLEASQGTSDEPLEMARHLITSLACRS